MRRSQVGEDEHIGTATELRERVGFAQRLRLQRQIRLHLSLDDQIRIGGAHQFGGVTHLYGLGVVGTAEGRERQHRYTRLHVEGASHVRRLHGDLRHFLCRGIDVDHRIREEQDLALHDHHVEAGHTFGACLETDDLQRRTHRFGEVMQQAADETVCIPHVHHHRPEVAPVAQALTRLGQGQPFALT